MVGGALVSPEKTVALVEDILEMDSSDDAQIIRDTEISLSKFALHLTSPMATLYVGKRNTEYHAHIDKLCHLSFFRRVLEIQPGKEQDSRVNMPEDDPEAVAALIEWLYFENYTYDANKLQAETIELRRAPENPSEGLLEGLFYLEVCIVALKYGCKNLFQETCGRAHATKKKLSDIDNFRLCRAEITSGLEELQHLPVDIPSLALNNQALRKWIGELFGEHRREVFATLREFPDFGTGLLEICTYDPSKD